MSQLVVLENGSLYAMSNTSMFAKLSLDGAVEWAIEPRRNRCQRAFGAPGDVLWTVCDHYRPADNFRIAPAVQRTDAVGRTRVVYDLNGVTALNLVSDGGVFAADYFGNDALIMRYAADGSRLWIMWPIELRRTLVRAMLELDNSHVLVVGVVLPEHRLTLTEADHAGGLVSQIDIDPGFPTGDILLARRETDGSLLLLLRHAENGSSALVQIKPDRSLGWVHALPPGLGVARLQLGRYALLRTENQETRIIARGQVNDEPGSQALYLAITADGQQRVSRPLGDSQQFRDFAPRPLQGDFLTAGRYARIDADGHIVDLGLSAIYDGREQPNVLASYSDGEERYAVVDTTQRRQLIAWTRGELSWSTELQRDLVWSSAPNTRAVLQVSDVALCVNAIHAQPGTVNSEHSPLQCFERSEGTLLHSFSSESLFGTTLNGQHLLLAGGVIARLERSGDDFSMRFQSVTDGHDVRPPRLLQGANYFTRLSGKPGGVAVGFGQGPGNEVHWFDGLQPESTILPSGLPLHVLAEGVLVGRQWFPRDGSPSIQFLPEGADVVSVNDDGQPVIMFIHEGAQSSLLGFDAAAGSVTWSHASPDFHSGLKLARGGGSALLLSDDLYSWDDLYLNIHAYDRDSGQALGRRSIECGVGHCQFLTDGPVAGSDGLDLLLLNLHADGTRTLRSVNQASAQPVVAPDQNGIAGILYHPRLQGQGLVITYIEASRTVFAPWFTYRTWGGNWEEADLRWVSLQGNVEPGTDVATLDILRNGGGIFAMPPATSPEVIGQAELQLTSCDRATLSLRYYDPNTNSFYPGSGSQQYPLIRLGPRTQPCIMDNDDVEPPALAVLDRNGFSTRQSGAWFDPATSGQGVMVEVVPAGPTQTGLLFGAWFTYDLAEQANDNLAQDWFILQADLAEGESGRVRAPIYRSIGGQGLRRATSNLFSVGSAELSFSSCTRLIIDYQFDDDPLAGPHAGLAGQLDLLRIGGCAEE